ncbi:MAG: response regulator [Flavobacteriales bacterium]
MISNTQKTILVLDDDALIAHDIAGILKDHGFNVIDPSHDYEDAIHSLQNHHIDIAVLDINLEEEKTGIDVASHIQNNYKMPYIFLTSYSDQSTLEAAQEVGPYGYLVKPFQEATLVTTLQMAMSNFERISSKIRLDFHGEAVSEREQDICQKLAEGKSYKDIAETEFISVNTVRYHIKNLYVKYDVNSRSELVSKLLT